MFELILLPQDNFDFIYSLSTGVFFCLLLFEITSIESHRLPPFIRDARMNFFFLLCFFLHLMHLKWSVFTYLKKCLVSHYHKIYKYIIESHTKCDLYFLIFIIMRKRCIRKRLVLVRGWSSFTVHCISGRHIRGMMTRSQSSGNCIFCWRSSIRITWYKICISCLIC